MTTLNEWIDTKIRDDDINYFEYDEFSNVEKVGNGAFGIVKRADWKSCGIKVALKILANNPSINEDNMNKFLKEVVIISIYDIIIFKVIIAQLYFNLFFKTS
jgi:serine/threonine protein kinase